MKRRLIERRRDEIALNISQAQVEYDSGQVFRGTVEQLMDEFGN